MKVYKCPIPEPNYGDYSNWQSIDKKFYTDLKTYITNILNYKGGLTGKLFMIPWADGHAVYMVGQGANNTKPFLIHCPVGDAWDVPEYMTRGITKADIIRQAVDFNDYVG